MDRTGTPDIDIEHAKYSDFMPVTNGKAAHCHPCQGIRRKYRVQSTKYPQSRAVVSAIRYFARYEPNKVPV